MGEILRNEVWDFIYYVRSQPFPHLNPINSIFLETSKKRFCMQITERSSKLSSLFLLNIDQEP